MYNNGIYIRIELNLKRYIIYSRILVLETKLQRVRHPFYAANFFVFKTENVIAF